MTMTMTKSSKTKSSKTKSTTKSKASAKPKRRMLIMDVETPPTAEQISKAEERARVVTFPCKSCGVELTPSNRSILQDGRVVHIGCTKEKRTSLREVALQSPKLQGLPKHRGAKVPTPPKQEEAGEYGDLSVKSDYQGRTCLQVKRDVQTVTYLPIDVSGLHLSYMATKAFDERFKPINYPVPKACEHFARYAADYGATDDVLRVLKRVVVITEEQEMAAKKKMDGKVTKVGTDGKTTVKKKSGGGTRASSAAGDFIKELVMKGGKSDDDIFKLAQEKFGLDDGKRAYVGWYRWKLKKEGKNPPAPVGVVKGMAARKKNLAEKKSAKPKKK